MTKRLLFFAVLLSIISLIPEAAAQYKPADIPAYLKPEADLNEAEKIWLENNYYIYKRSKPIPPEVFEEFKKNPPRARILNEESGIELINTTNGAGAQAETWIAINPTNPDNIIATANDSRYFVPSNGYKMAAYVTHDGGKTWETTLTPENQDIWIPLTQQPWNMTIFDPGIAFDTKGNAYYSYGFCETIEQWEDDNGVFVSKSTDGGRTWGLPNAVAYETGSDIPFHDRYSIAVDVVPGSPYKDNIYVTWQKFSANGGDVLFSKSQDGGELFTSYIALPGSVDYGTQSPVPTVGPGGSVHVVWRQAITNMRTKAMYQKSTDGGNTWLPSAINVQTVNTCGEQLGGRIVLADKENMRVSSGPDIAVDYSDGPRRGWVYVVQAGREQEDGPYGIYLARSTDAGKTWENEIRIDDNPLRNDMFFPSITCDPVTGAVSILYYSSQNDEGNQGVDAYLAYSSDGMEFTNIRLTPETYYINNSDDVAPQGSADNYYWGDYTCITSYDGKIYPLFWMADPINGNFYNLECYTAVLSSSPKTPTNLQAMISEDEIEKVTLSWEDPLTNVFGQALGDFVIKIFRDGSFVADVPKGIMTYEDTQLESGKKYNYRIQASSSEGNSPFISTSAYAGGAPKPFPPFDIHPRPTENGIMLAWTNPIYHIDSTGAYDLDKVLVYIDGELAETVSNEIQAGTSSSVMLDLETELFYEIKLKAVGLRSSVETESDFSREVIAYAGAPSTEFTENFDDTGNLIPTYTNGNWAATDEASFSAPNCLSDSPNEDYPEGNTFIMFAPTVVSPEKTTLSFEHIALIDDSPADMGVISISNDFGYSWSDLIWLDKNLDPENFGNDLASSNFVSFHRSLADYTGDTILIRFSLFANRFVNDEGWFIDDLRIDDDPNAVDELDLKKTIATKVYPNPSGGLTNISIVLPMAAEMEIAVYDNIGNELFKIEEGTYSPGEYVYPLNLSAYPSGIYYCRIKAGTGTRFVPVVVSK